MSWWASQKARSDAAKEWPGGRLAYAKAKTATKDGTKGAAVIKVDNPRQAGNLIEAMKAYGYELEQQSGAGAFGGKALLTFTKAEAA